MKVIQIFPALFVFFLKDADNVSSHSEDMFESIRGEQRFVGERLDTFYKRNHNFIESIPQVEKMEEKFHNAILDNRDSILIGRYSDVNHGRKMQVDGEYKPIRIKFITSELEENLEDEKVKLIMEKVLPKVKSFYSKLLKTKPYLESSIEIPEDSCFGEMSNIPKAILKNGVKNADVAIYVKAEECGVEGAIAAATPCGLSSYDFRPLVGIIYFCLESDMIMQEDEDNSEIVGVAIHEMAHVLGMNSDLLPFYINRETGQPLLTEPKVSWVMCVDNMPRRVLFPSDKVLQQVVSESGSRHFEIVTPTVATVVRNQFDCQEMNGARLENQPTAPQDCFGSHWDERLYYTEAMSAIYNHEHNALSPLTLALLEDSGWYIGNYTVTKKSTFGMGAGCGFVNDNCITDGGDVASSSKGYFCNSLSSFSRQSITCTPTHVGVGYCDLFDFEEENLNTLFLPPKKFQYFDDNIAPVFFDRADFCPIAIPLPENSSCQVDDSGNKVLDRMCVNIDSFRRNFVVECVQFHCNRKLKKLQMSTLDSNRILTCDFDFQMHDHPIVPRSKIECPRLAVMCPNFFCPSNCSGKGICDYSGNSPKCVCFDESDKSSSCNNEAQPTNEPSIHPSTQPEAMPSDTPSIFPSNLPSEYPSFFMSEIPSTKPSSSPSSTLSHIPSSIASKHPSPAPSKYPSFSPTEHTMKPSTKLTSQLPSDSPTMKLSFQGNNTSKSLFSAISNSSQTTASSVNPTQSPVFQEFDNPKEFASSSASSLGYIKTLFFFIAAATIATGDLM